jgi:uncharacterized protein YehS (DUF1456 family)
VRRRGRNLLLSPLDWALIESWKTRGVPLAVVLRSIETVFDNAENSNKRRKPVIKSLFYCRDEVEAQFEAWLEMQTGKNSKTKVREPKTEIQSEIIIKHLRKIAAELRRERAESNGGWQRFSFEILSDLERAQAIFGTSGDVEKLEILLSELDRRIDENLPKLLTTQAFEEIKTETAAALRSHKNKMTADAYSETFRALLNKNLRDRLELPRFSLIYL